MARRRAFLDANILFSAAYVQPALGIIQLWRLPVVLVTSHYAAEEACRNLPSAGQKAELQGLLSRMEVRAILAPPDETLFRNDYGLPQADRPILWGAIDAKCDYLVTGDKKHFGSLYGRKIEGVEIIRARDLIVRLESSTRPQDRISDQDPDH